MSLDADIDRLLAESQDATRFRDFAMVARRLTLSLHVPEGTELTDDTGRGWVADEVAADGKQPVHGAVLWESAAAADGTVLRWRGGEVRLCAEVVVSAGGVWDSQKRCYKTDADGKLVPAQKPIVVDLVESQVEACRWFAQRLKAFRERQKHPHMVGELFADRRAGKTFVGVLFILLTVFECPTVDGQPLVAWLISVQHNVREEIDATISKLVPAEYFVFRELPKRMYLWANGATCLHKTVDDPEGALKAGRCDVALLNEASAMPFKAYRNVLRAVQDKHGFLILCTNTPTRTKGSWVTRLADGAQKDEREGREPALKLFKLDPKQNAAISQEAKAQIDKALRYALDDGDSLDEGVILEADEKCFSPPFDEAQHVRPLPQVGLVDVTAEITQRLYGGRFSYLVGADWQMQSASAAFKVFAPSVRDLDKFVLVCTHAWFLREGGDEYDIIDCVQSAGLTGLTALTVGDCSGGSQNNIHSYGPPSFDIYQRLGWPIVGPTEKKTDRGKHAKNPPVEKSIGRFRTLIKEGRFFVVAGEDAAGMAVALKKCEARIDAYRNLRPKGIHAHLGDCARYVAWWLLAKPHLLTDNVSSIPAAVSGRKR